MKHLFSLRAFIKPYALQIAANLFALLAVTGLSLFVPRILQRVIDDGLLHGQVGYLARAALLLLGLGLAIALLNLIQHYLSEWTAARIGYDLRNAMYDRIQHLPFTFHDHTQSGQLITRCIEDVRAIQDFAGSGIIELVQLLFLSVGVTAMMISTNAGLAVIALLPFIPLAMMTSLFGDRVTKLFYNVDLTLGDLSTRLQENVTGVQVVRAFAREAYEIDRFDESNRKYFESRLKVIHEWSKVMPTTTLLITLGTILILFFGGQMVLQGTMTIGEIVAFNSYMLMLSAPIQELTWLVNGAGEAAAGAQRVLEILDHEPEIRSPAKAVTLPTLERPCRIPQRFASVSGREILCPDRHRPDRRAEPDRRPDRADRFRQDLAGQPDPALLRCDGGRGARGRGGRPLGGSRLAAPPDRHRPADPAPFLRLDQGQHRLRQAGGRRRGNHRRGEGFAGARVHHRPPQRLRDHRRRARRDAQRRTAPAGGDRARPVDGSPHPYPG